MTRSYGHSALIAALAVIIIASGCVARRPAGEPPPGATPAQKVRPTSTATLAIVEPQAGAILSGPRIQVKMALTGGRVIPETKTDLRPDEGHIHIKLDGRVVSMTYGTEQQIAVTPGTRLLEAEYVAADHFPFNPRVVAIATFIVR